MRVFLLAILINLVIRWSSVAVVNWYVKNKSKKDELLESNGFYIAFVTYSLNNIVLLINVTILAALAVKYYLFPLIF